MSIGESIRMALRSLGANKLRAGLTMLGIIIGTGAVIALISVGQGAQVAITEQVQSIGSNLIFVFAGRFDQSRGAQGMRSFAPLTMKDVEALDPSRLQYVAAVAPQVEGTANVTYRSESTNVSVTGTTPEFRTVRSFDTEYGEFFTASDVSAVARVAILGADTAESLFATPEEALQQTIRINRIPFQVVAVLAKKGGQGFGGGSADNIVVIPITTAQKRLFASRQGSDGEERIDLINVSAIDEASIEPAIDEITWALRDERKIEFEEDDFTVTSQQDILGVFNQITNVLTIFLGAIAGISLLVGGIGIMNIMLVSVTERTREIGIRKAVGAKRSNILTQFLIESVVLSVLGGTTGIGLGWSIAEIVNTLGAFTTRVSPQAVILAFGFSLFVGLFFGIYPASRASNLNPIDALRYE
jgi:putative ABC transport system permease protein